MSGVFFDQVISFYINSEDVFSSPGVQLKIMMQQIMLIKEGTKQQTVGRVFDYNNKRFRNPRTVYGSVIMYMTVVPKVGDSPAALLLPVCG